MAGKRGTKPEAEIRPCKSAVTCTANAPRNQPEGPPKDLGQFRRWSTDLKQAAMHRLAVPRWHAANMATGYQIAVV
jgi:hypothetical protein